MTYQKRKINCCFMKNILNENSLITKIIEKYMLLIRECIKRNIFKFQNEIKFCELRAIP